MNQPSLANSTGSRNARVKSKSPATNPRVALREAVKAAQGKSLREIVQKHKKRLRSKYSKRERP